MGRLPVPRGECRFTIAALAPLRHDFSVPFRSLFFRHLLLRPTALLASLGLALLAGCGQKPAGTGGPATSSVPVFTYEVVHTWPHDPGAFTQGLVYQPLTDESFWAEKGRGAWLQDRRLRVSARREDAMRTPSPRAKERNGVTRARGERERTHTANRARTPE